MDRIDFEDKEVLDKMVEKYGIKILLEELNQHSLNDNKDIVSIINTWKGLLKSHFGVSPMINYGKSKRIIKNVLKSQDVYSIGRILEHYVEWIENNPTNGFGLDISIALSNWFINLWKKEVEQYN